MVSVRTEARKGWFFAPSGELRECIVVNMSMGVGQVAVIDTATGLPIDVRPEDVLTEPPEQD